MTRPARSPCNVVRRDCRCSSLMTSSETDTELTPGTRSTAAVTSRVMRSRKGQPCVVSRMPTVTWPPSATSTEATMPRSVMGRWISGSLTVARAARMSSFVGRLMAVPRYGAAPGPSSGGDSRAPLHQREHALLEQGGFHRFGQVVVRARIAGLCLEVHVGAAGQHQHRRRRRLGLATQEPDHLHAGEVWQKVVDEHTVVRRCRGEVEPLAGRRNPDYFDAAH